MTISKIAICGSPLSGKRTLALSLLRANGMSAEPARKIQITDRYVMHYRLNERSIICLCSGSIFSDEEILEYVLKESEIVVFVDRIAAEVDPAVERSRAEYWRRFENIFDAASSRLIYVQNSCEEKGVFMCSSLVPLGVESFSLDVKHGNVTDLLTSIIRR